MTGQRQAQMGQTFFALNTLGNAPEYHNFDTARQQNKAPRPQKNINNRWQPYPIRGTQDSRQHEPEPHAQLLPQPRFQAYPPDLYINQNFVPPGPAPEANYEMASTLGAGGIQYGRQSMQMTMGPASVAPPPSTYLHQPRMASYPPYDNVILPPMQAAAGFDAPVMQAQLHALPEGVKYWPALHSLKDLQVPIMPQYPPAPSMAQSQMQATSYDQHFDWGLMDQASSECAAEGSSVQRTKRKAVDSDEAVRKKQQKNPRIRPDNDPEFQQVVKNGKVLYKCLKEQCGEMYLKESSVREHKQTNKHQKRSNRLPCLGCGHYFSRSDGLKRHANSEQCSKNQQKTYAVAPTNVATGTFMVSPPVNVPQGPFTFQGTGLAAQQAPPPFVIEPDFSSGPATQPVVQTPRLNSMTHKATSFAQDTLSLPDVQSSVQAPHEQRPTSHQPSGVPLTPIIDQEWENDMDLFGSPVSLALPGHGDSALDSVAPAPSTSQFDASESYWDWYKRLEQPVHGDLASIY
ncbi:hypothetical protein BDR05DRAFT_801688 [Suillus weaverae]|nr:hypothetical protein BDR05DRAFT_801688 [Suillus weaverae]